MTIDLSKLSTLDKRADFTEGDGFKSKENCDFFGQVFNDFDSNLDECIDKCKKDFKCTHFVFRDNKCFHKTIADDKLEPSDSQNGGTCGIVSDNLKDLIETTKARTTLEKFAPKVWIMSDEESFPANVKETIDGSERKESDGKTNLFIPESLHPGNKGRLADTFCYGFYVPKGSDVFLVYWFFYNFNPGRSIFDVESHPGDWEHFSIKLDADLNPQEAYAAAHSSGTKANWNDIEKEGDRPVVYSAQISHATFFNEGKFPLKAFPLLNDETNQGEQWDTQSKMEVFFWGDRKVQSVGNKEFPDQKLPEWLTSGFINRWGDDEDGPTGPVDKEATNNPDTEFADPSAEVFVPPEGSTFAGDF
ncbi:Vacuolar protein sorting-associated protein 62 [Globomyces sp. JEL0801]|nr:Vacuolar protein sorting-associated protein 62 [Globomyces sp. JEL0801]